MVPQLLQMMTTTVTWWTMLHSGCACLPVVKSVALSLHRLKSHPSAAASAVVQRTCAPNALAQSLHLGCARLLVLACIVFARPHAAVLSHVRRPHGLLLLPLALRGAAMCVGMLGFHCTHVLSVALSRCTHHVGSGSVGRASPAVVAKCPGPCGSCVSVGQVIRSAARQVLKVSLAVLLQPRELLQQAVHATTAPWMEVLLWRTTIGSYGGWQSTAAPKQRNSAARGNATTRTKHQQPLEAQTGGALSAMVLLQAQPPRRTTALVMHVTTMAVRHIIGNDPVDASESRLCCVWLYLGFIFIFHMPISLRTIICRLNSNQPIVADQKKISICAFSTGKERYASAEQKWVPNGEQRRRHAIGQSDGVTTFIDFAA